MSERIPESEWRWYGMPGHFIACQNCCFHIVTDIGKYRISSIGCYHEPEIVKHGTPTYANRRPIGYGRLYETMVFEVGANGEHGGSSLDMEGYNEEADAEAGHLAMCRKWADPTLYKPVLEGAA